MFKQLVTAAVATMALTGAAQAATMTGVFDVTVVNVTNLNSDESRATIENAEAAFDKANGEDNGFGGEDSVAMTDDFTFEGALDFGTFTGTDSTTIEQWLDTSAGSITSGLDATIGDKQLSKDSIGNGTATTSFFYFELVGAIGATDFIVTHDDGFAIFEDNERVGGDEGPTVEVITEILGFDGGTFGLLYVATNGNPSVLNVNATPVPLPAGMPLLLAGLGGLALMRRRAKG